MSSLEPTCWECGARLDFDDQLAAMTSERDALKKELAEVWSLADKHTRDKLDSMFNEMIETRRERDAAVQALAAWKQTEWPVASQDPKWAWFNDRLRDALVEVEELREALTHAETTRIAAVNVAEAAEGEVKRLAKVLRAVRSLAGISPLLRDEIDAAIAPAPKETAAEVRSRLEFKALSEEQQRANLEENTIRRMSTPINQGRGLRPARIDAPVPEPSEADVDRDVCVHGWAGCDQCFAAWSARERELLDAVATARRDALEEAAKVVEEFDSFVVSWVPLTTRIAAALRALS